MAMTALVRNGTGATTPPNSSATTAASRAGPFATGLLGHQQPGQPNLGRQCLPQSIDNRPVRVVQPGDGGRITPGAEQIPHAGAQIVLDFGVKQIEFTHLAISFHGTSLSTRGSAGRPSTRSATMLRRISEVPPSMELPLARK